MRINDEEDLIQSIYQFVMANLNAKIDAINAEKADNIQIKEIAADCDHYIFAGSLLEMPNNDFVNFTIMDIDLKANQTDITSLVKISVEVVFDNEKEPTTYFKSLRYMRALYETLLDYAPSAPEVDGYQLTKATPMVITAIKRTMVVSGVIIECAIG